MSTLVSQAIIDSFFNGRNADPFATLGMHETEQGIEVRVLLPEAEKVIVLDKESQNEIATLHRIDERGFFAGVMPEIDSFFNYQLQVFWGNEAVILEDPYRFHLMINELDNWLLAEGSHSRPYEVLGAHFTQCDKVSGVIFRLWAPNAKRVSVVGDFNYWDGRRHPMRFHAQSGVWELFIPKVSLGQLYKFELLDANDNLRLKADPYAFASQLRPDTASQVSVLPEIAKMTKERAERNQNNKPISIYEVHLGSWRRNIENNFWLDYDQLADELIPYVKEMGFTHVEFLPISEFPYDGSWGYQPVGLYAPTSRFGSPEAFKRLIDRAHEEGINVILDWVPGHFPSDTHGLSYFDGTALYEHADPREGYHQDWNTLIYNYGRHEVQNYLSSNALYWLERFGIDGLRVDAVASMVYRDYSRKDGEWIPNAYGGRENLEAIEFLKHTNWLIHSEMPETISIAEESTSFPLVTGATENGGLGFNFKWNMGWMNDTLTYLKMDPIYRQYHHDKMTFSMMYQYSENFVLPLSHDEVVHGKYSLINKMSGDKWQKFATLRAYYAYMWAHPGKKLLFMGNEFAQWREWNFEESLDWFLLNEEHEGWHTGVQQLVKDLNKTYQNNTALYALDNNPQGFEWLVVDDYSNSIFVFERKDDQGNVIIAISNFTPVPRSGYRFGVNTAGEYEEILNTDADIYKGSNVGNSAVIKSEAIPSHNKEQSIAVQVPPLATVYLKLKVKPKRTRRVKTAEEKAAAAKKATKVVKKAATTKTSTKATTAKTTKATTTKAKKATTVVAIEAENSVEPAKKTRKVTTKRTTTTKATKTKTTKE